MTRRGYGPKHFERANIDNEKAKNSLNKYKKRRQDNQIAASSSTAATTQPFDLTDEIAVRDKDGNADGSVITGTNHEPDFSKS